MKRSVFFIGLFLICFNGCLAKNYIKGDYYLQSNNTKDGIQYFESVLDEEPEDAWANYFLGRCLLAEKQIQKAIPPLRKAVEINSNVANFHFWLGVAYGTNKNYKSERQSYEKALALSPKHLQALVYLGHNFQNAKKYTSALKQYDAAIKIWSESPSALYNRAKILNNLGRTPEEKKAWLTYLENYSSGTFARNAVGSLNRLGDFTYRNFLIGLRTITIKKIEFNDNLKVTSKTKPYVDRVAKIMKSNKKVSIHVVVYQKGNKTLANDKAKAVKNYIVGRYSQITPERIKLSWFGTSEKIKIKKKKHFIWKSRSDL